jgi:branched-chain amino acid transport system ATP-binding protein
LSLLKADDIHTYYGRSYILQGVSLEVLEGEIVALLGRNGAGKTTTLKALTGLVKPKAGRIHFKSVDVTPFPAFRVARLGMGYVPQGRGLFPQMTVLENLRTGIRNRKNEAELENVFSLFPVLKERLKQKAGTLSGGEQQSLAIGRALLTQPDILLLDEPTTGLMPIIVSNLKDILRRLNSSGMAILLVEEKVPFALALADRLYFMTKGKVVYSDTRHNLEGKQEVFVKYLGVEV